MDIITIKNNIFVKNRYISEMSSKKNDTTETWLTILFGVLAVLMIKSIFENDSSKIVSQKGRKILSDDKKMKEINDKITSSEGENQHQEIYV